MEENVSLRSVHVTVSPFQGLCYDGYHVGAFLTNALIEIHPNKWDAAVGEQNVSIDKLKYAIWRNRNTFPQIFLLYNFKVLGIFL